MTARIMVWVVLFSSSLSGADRLSDEVTALKEQVQELQKVVAALQSRVDQLDPKPQMLNAAATATNPPAEAQRPEPPPPPAAPARRLPPVTFGGDFRLYFDALTRPEGGGAPRVQNLRGRYQLHLDFESALYRTLTVHAQIASGQWNNQLTDIQDFGAGSVKQPFFIGLAYADYHPNRYITLQGGRVDSPFNDKSRFLFDIDTKFNGTTEIFRAPLHNAPFGFKRVQFLAGQYILTNPSFPIIAPGTPSTAAAATPSQALLAAGATPGTQPRDSALLQQGLIVDNEFGAFAQQTQFDMQIYRNPNQLRLMSTPAGLFLISGTIGILPANPLPSPGNATTTSGGAKLAASAFRIAHLSYTVAHRGIPMFGHSTPVSLNAQFARNTGAQSERDAVAVIVSAGRSSEAGDIRLLGAFYQKQANSLLSEMTEYDIAIGGNVNMNAYMGRFDYTFSKNVVFVNNFIWTNWLQDSNPARQFFVPLGSHVPTQFRYQGILMFHF